MIQAKQAASTQLTERLEAAIDRAQDWLLEQQATDGHWCAELEGDTILESEYLIYLHFIDSLEPTRLRKVANYIRSKALHEGGWSIYPGGPMDLSSSVKAYLALKLAGDPLNSPLMSRTRDAILAAGGVTRCNTFTKIYLAV
jgi:squalene-hopene/tetraprenyl-beta-curcumene cyclase